MEIQRNMANVIRALKEASGKSLSEFSEELEVSRSTLQEYLAGKGNPSIATIEHLSEKLGVDASFLISGIFSEDQIGILLKLLDMLKLLYGLSAEQRVRFVQLLLEMVSLCNEDDNHA